jgi:hypothetical protein
MGARLGAAIAAAMALPAGAPGAGAPAVLRAASATVELPTLPLPSEAEAAAFLEEQRSWAAEAPGAAEAAACEQYAADRLALVRAEAAAAAAAAAGAAGAAVTLPLTLHALRVGGVALIGVEGELFSEFEAALSRLSPFAGATLVAGYCGGCLGYLPTEAECAQGGYEVCHAFKVYGQMRQLAPRAERGILRGARALLDELAAPPAPAPPAAPRTSNATPTSTSTPSNCMWPCP